MSQAICKTCPAWNGESDAIFGECALNPPEIHPSKFEPGSREAADLSFRWPITAATSWCMQHPQRLARNLEVTQQSIADVANVWIEANRQMANHKSLFAEGVAATLRWLRDNREKDPFLVLE